MRITYFVHGTTTDNENKRATGWLPGTLSETGKQQARELPSLIKDTSFSVVIASDLQRAIDSAQLGFGSTHPIRTDSRLREANYGKWNGDTHHFKENMIEYIDNPFPEGESYRDVEARIRNLIQELKAEGLVHVAFMAHEAPQLALEVISNHKTWGDAVETNWRRTKAWQPGWIYEVL